MGDTKPKNWAFWPEDDEYGDPDDQEFVVGNNPQRHDPDSNPFRWGMVCERVPNFETAALISAAPDLYETALALDTFLSKADLLDHGQFVKLNLSDLIEHLRPLRAALQKARGES